MWPLAIACVSALAAADSSADTTRPEPPELRSVVIAATSASPADGIASIGAAVLAAGAGPEPGTGLGGAGGTPPPFPITVTVTEAPDSWVEPALVAAAILNGYNAAKSGPPAIITVRFSEMPSGETLNTTGGTVVGDIWCAGLPLAAGAAIACEGRLALWYPRPLVLLLHELLHAVGFTGAIDGFTGPGGAEVRGAHWTTASPEWSLMRAILPAGPAGLWRSTLDAVRLDNHCGGALDTRCPNGTQCEPVTPGALNSDVALPWRCAAYAPAPITREHYHLPPGYERVTCTMCGGQFVAAGIVAALCALAVCICAVPAHFHAYDSASPL